MSSKVNPLDKARELGYAILQSVEYENLIKAEEDYYNDPDATLLVKRLNDKKSEYNLLDDKSDKENEINKLQQAIENNTAIQNLYQCKNRYNKLLTNIDNIIKFITNESERTSIDTVHEKRGCNGCSGCCKK
ncbi:hypothetical protein Curi_c15160 [Gottschalkia acidurici 9a]|uniref:YlbF family regulator n=1 Tax=Gottschalkia acidurici (strain ATCC 7906 / DSM 604 / BCRC 14475 / CIP 104303 / KCTC 5404 / NCIMB 10678 / 9a) TaxID=1128398 RepID=K0B0T2_GOTA9|nr:YlbF family regulator [Gottschalkia acidurici]AFS78525.1 hypothetical protein Curi_c15160 [Gottschalkia acidurici 9a]